MAGLVTQTEVITRGQTIAAGATRALQQARNGIGAQLAEYQAWADEVPDAGFDTDTLAEIETRKQQVVTLAQTLQAELTAALAALTA